MSCLRVTVARVRTLSLQHYDFLPQFLSGLRDLLGPTKIAPIIFVGAEGDNLFSPGSETQVGSDDGESGVFIHHLQKAGRNHLDAGKGQRVQLLAPANELRLIVPGPSAAKLKLIVEQQVARGVAVLHRQSR